MSRILAKRLTAQSLKPGSQSSRLLSTTPTLRDEQPSTAAPSATPKPKARPSLLESIYGTPQAKTATPSGAMNSLSNSSVLNSFGKSSLDTSSLFGAPAKAAPPPAKKTEHLEPYHLHIYSHKHNTHVSCTKPNGNTIITMSTGQVGFKKGKRKGFDSAYSLTKYVFERLLHTGWPNQISRLELVMNGFGKGREAAIKVLMSPEGKMLRDKIVRVTDATKVKFGGTRSRKMKRR